VMTHPLEIKKIPYSSARPMIRVGDGIGYRSKGIMPWAIRLCKGGMYDFSHWSTVIRDREIGPTARVMVWELLGKGPRMSYLSEPYAEKRRLFWVPMHCTPDQQEIMLEEAAELECGGLEYDFKTTIGQAILSSMSYDCERFNCSEAGWHLWLVAGRVKHRHDDRGRPIAPVPGDVPVWAEATAIYELDMKA